jgi:hypothetical protein
MAEVRKITFLMGFYAIYGNVLTADVICLCMRKFNIPERYKTVRECTCE